MKTRKTSNEAAPDVHQRPEGFESVGAILNRILAERGEFSARQLRRAQMEMQREDRKLPPLPNYPLTSAD
jgi:hypothetical protein